MIAPYLHFGGNCREAMTFYAEVLGGTDIMMMTAAESPPDQVPPSFGPDSVMHCQFTAGSSVLMGSDTAPEFHQPQAGVSVYHGAASAESGAKIFGALAEGGEVIMPFAATFWSKGFGMLKDRFGTHWMISLSPEAEAAAA